MNSIDGFNQQKDTELRILKAAEKEFLEKGFSGARTASIAATAGVTHAMFHYYFRTKDKLFEKIISEKIGLLTQNLLPVVLNIDVPLDQYIKGVIDQHLEFVAANPSLPGFIIRELNSGSSQAEAILGVMRKLSHFLLEKIDEKLKKAAAEGLCCPIEASALIIDIVSLNIFPYLASPILNAALDNCMADSAAFLEARKKENYMTIMRRIRPLRI